ncbi:hypothetical protein Dsin_016987 [Dipteronia sinensis]|uniref:Reverse transcriptase domain-containing protein n=1 Tax=Dipteronia sinensis TaxID=43782 RepID=A0AAE0AEQ8_9ROSI|nr:hypothetical protein Dsin_016987 [Dipteronia sinensis]
MDYLRNSIRILRCFELASGLKINFHKSCMVRVGKNTFSGEGWPAAFKCKLGSFPLNYLGLYLGGRPSSKDFWKDLPTRLESRLAHWKMKFLNKGGRLVLIIAVLSSILTYYLSIFKIHVGVALSI